MFSPRAGTTVLSLLLTVVLSACGSTSAAPTVTGAWVRPPMGADLPAAGYATIVGGSAADALLSASTPVATSVEVHETMAGASGMTGMQPVGRIDVPAGGTVKLEPGGYHLMLMGVKEELIVGGKVEITLTFEKAGRITVQAEVRAG